MLSLHFLGKFLACICNNFLSELREIGGIDLDPNSSESAMKSLLGSSVHHLRLYLRGVRRPSDQNKLTCGAPIVSGELHVVKSVSAVILRDLRQKIVELAVHTDVLLLDHIIVDLIDHISGLQFAQLDVVELRDTRIINRYTGRHSKMERRYRKQQLAAENTTQAKLIDGGWITSTPSHLDKDLLHTKLQTYIN